jgi:hypothetical protein
VDTRERDNKSREKEFIFMAEYYQNRPERTRIADAERDFAIH